MSGVVLTFGATAPMVAPVGWEMLVASTFPPSGTFEIVAIFLVFRAESHWALLLMIWLS